MVSKIFFLVVEAELSPSMSDAKTGNESKHSSQEERADPEADTEDFLIDEEDIVQGKETVSYDQELSIENGNSMGC